MIKLSPREYCIVANPILRDELGCIIIENGNTVNRIAEKEIRFFFEYNNPFPLYHGERVDLQPTKLIVLHKEESLVVEAT